MRILLYITRSCTVCILNVYVYVEYKKRSYTLKNNVHVFIFNNLHYALRMYFKRYFNIRSNPNKVSVNNIQPLRVKVIVIVWE